MVKKSIPSAFNGDIYTHFRCVKCNMVFSKKVKHKAVKIEVSAGKHEDGIMCASCLVEDTKLSSIHDICTR